LAGISGLDALANQYSFPDAYIAVVLDAHRSQVFYAEYISRKGRVRKTSKPSLLHISELERLLSDRHIFIVGDINVCSVEEIRHASAGWPRPVFSDPFLAAGIGRLAFSRKRTWRSGDRIVAEPLYIRPPDALKNRGRKR
jgi:tRNA A37 threonylcarbamoyladenosine modification protein TsaB